MFPAIGDRVKMIGIMDDPSPLALGDEGLVTRVKFYDDPVSAQISVDWESGRTLMLLESDPFVIL